MMGRCYAKGNGKGPYKYYGAKGIDVSPTWHSFEEFLRDMGTSWFDGASLDRIDNKKGYSKSNCRWVTEKEQRLNKVNTLIFIHNGHQKTLRDLSKESGLKRDTLYRRLIILKWPIEKAVTFPNRYGFKK